MAESLLPLVAYCALMSGTPGPNNVLLASSGANFGYRRTLPLILGINAGVFMLTVAMCLGLAKVFAQAPVLHMTLRLVCVLYLMHLSWALATATTMGGGFAARPMTFAQGALFQLANPKSWAKGATMAAVFLPADANEALASIQVAAIGFAVGFPLISLWTLFGAAMRSFLASEPRLRLFNGVMGLALFGLALALLYEQWAASAWAAQWR